jgi:hypothetical protein
MHPATSELYHLVMTQFINIDLYDQTVLYTLNLANLSPNMSASTLSARPERCV